MEENKNKLHSLVDSIDNPKILENLIIIITDYVGFYANRQQTNEEG